MRGCEPEPEPPRIRTGFTARALRRSRPRHEERAAATPAPHRLRCRRPLIRRDPARLRDGTPKPDRAGALGRLLCSPALDGAAVPSEVEEATARLAARLATRLAARLLKPAG
ncbi:hypothetical protein [Nonomuraea rubra]|uniref:Uncharacterized protein n=1 Tax=Nonomuraea rubra TaxID=46180 RepID=A0A7X0NV11_9ACTN|nr:hypothetical protein [Nonomuraea rubra]MBB6550105.1 hypothetical protein [Nonomuraea rubra]